MKNDPHWSEYAGEMAFLAWAEHTHPVLVNNLREAYQRYKEMKK